MKFRILSYNTHKLFNITHSKYFLSELKKNLSQMDLDFVFLQEIRGEHPPQHQSSYSEDPLEHLADELWDHFIYGKNAIYSSGSHGNAILSKFSFNQWDNYDISNHRWEKRSLLVGNSKITNLNQEKNLLLSCTHLDLTQIGRTLQLNKIENYLNQKHQRDSPLILCGDMNDWNGQSTKKLLSLGYKATPALVTFPSFYPFLKLDRVFYKNLKLIKTKTLNGDNWKRLSDHLPIYAEFETELKTKTKALNE